MLVNCRQDGERQDDTGSCWYFSVYVRPNLEVFEKIIKVSILACVNSVFGFRCLSAERC